jgi:serine/threonine-protein kinase
MDEVLGALDRGGIATGRPAQRAEVAPGKARPAKQGASRALLAGAAIAVGASAVAGLGLFALTRPKPPAPAQVTLAPGAAVGRVKQSLSAELRAIPCAWLRLASVSGGPNGVSVRVTGVAGSPIDAQSAINRIAGAAQSHLADLDLAGVGQIGQTYCSTIDAFAPFRSDTVEGGERLASNQQVYTMARAADGALSAKAVIQIRLGDPGQNLALIGIDQNGKLTTIVPDRAALERAVTLKQIDQQADDSYTLPLATLDPGWSGILLLTGRGALDTGLFDAPANARDQDWRRRVGDALRAGDWKSEMVWYRAVAPSA